MEVVATFVPAPGEVPVDGVRRPPAGASVVEVRADLLPGDTDLGELVAAAPLPLLVTLRSRAEGGLGPDDAAARRTFFTAAARLPGAMVDLEAARDRELLGTVVPAARAVVSAHLPDGVPADLEARVRALLAWGSRLVKVVPTVGSVAEVAAVLRVSRALATPRRDERRLVLFGSGEVGRVTRLLGPLLGAPVAYAAWGAGRAAAPGQVPPEELLALTGHLDGPPRAMCAVLGRPVGGSLSPRMHAAAYRALGLAWLFAPLEVGLEAELDDLLCPAGTGALAGLGVALPGFAVTMPWKQAAARRCTVLAPRAARADAVNTVLPRRGRVLGDCTDIDGVTRALLQAGVALGGRPALVLGSGGAARAAAVALDMAGARVGVLASDPARGRELAAALGVVAATAADASSCPVLVNATPAGASGEPDERLERLALPAGAAVVDLPYGATPTRLERLAAERGWRYVSGREVLLWQGVAQLAAMTGAPPPVAAMACALGLEAPAGAPPAR